MQASQLDLATTITRELFGGDTASSQDPARDDVGSSADPIGGDAACSKHKDNCTGGDGDAQGGNTGSATGVPSRTAAKRADATSGAAKALGSRSSVTAPFAAIVGHRPTAPERVPGHNDATDTRMYPPIATALRALVADTNGGATNPALATFVDAIW